MDNSAQEARDHSVKESLAHRNETRKAQNKILKDKRGPNEAEAFETTF